MEEAAALLRVGRTKAYAMAREWRATEGRSGLPVLDFGNVLRVPRYRLELMVGAELRGPARPDPPAAVATAAVEEGAAPDHHDEVVRLPAKTEVGRGRSARRRSHKADDRQLSLLQSHDVTDASDVNASTSNTDRATEAQ